MKISASKKQLAKIISENGGWRDGANLALFGKESGRCYLLKTDEWPEYDATIKGFYINAGDVVSEFTSAPFANWHQTILSHDEYFHLYPAPDADGWIEWHGGECPTRENQMVDTKHRDGRTELNRRSGEMWWDRRERNGDIIAYRPRNQNKEQAKPWHAVIKPTIEQLAADYRAKLAIAQRAQEEADSHRCGAEAALEKLVSSGKALGLVLSVAEPDPELVITDWRDLLPGDELVALRVNNVDDADGKRCFVVKTQDNASGVFVYAKFDDGNTWWVREWRFIRRP